MFRVSSRILMNNRRCLAMEYSNVAHVSNSSRYNAYIDSPPIKLLSRILGVSSDTAIFILKTTNLKNKSDSHITKCYDICVKYGIDKKTLYSFPSLLGITPSQLEKRILFFKDAGCERIFATMIIYFYPICNQTISNLKLQKILPQDADVPKNLLSCIDLPSSCLSRVEPLSEDLSLSSVYEQILRVYLQWKLELTTEKLESIMKSHQRQRNQSLTLIKKSLELLESQFGLSKKKISQNCVLITKNPSSLEEVLNEMEKFGEIDMKALINRHPRILQLTLSNIHSKVEFLKEQGIKNEAIARAASILVYASDDLREKITEFHSLPQLRGLWSHPRIMVFISRLSVVKQRIALLKQLNVRCSSLNMLSNSNCSFNRFMSMGSDRTRGKDLLTFLSYELDTDVNDIRTSLSRHPFWCYASIFHAQETLYFLKEQHYSNKAIIDNVQIVLYYRLRIQQELDIIDSTIVCNELSNWNQSRKLALCLYNIEKYYHFDGNGIWDSGQGEVAVN